MVVGQSGPDRSQTPCFPYPPPRRAVAQVASVKEKSWVPAYRFGACLRRMPQQHPREPRPAAPSETAVLVFARSTAAEAAAKPLARGSGRNRRLHHACALRLRRALSGVRLPVVTIDERRQRGTTFGERFVAALADVRALGYTKVVAVGRDCPDLTASHLLLAARALVGGAGLALGADHRGGAYLLALDLSKLPTDRLLDLPWCTDELAEGMRRLAGKASDLFELEPLADLNDASAVERLLWRKRGLRRWHALTPRRARPRPQATPAYAQEVRFGESLSLRGPPAV